MYTEYTKRYTKLIHVKRLISNLNKKTNGMAGLEEIKAVLERKGLLKPNAKDFEQAYKEALKDPEIRKLLEIETPEITDLSDLLRIQNGGKVYAVRMDLNHGVDNHKKPVVAGLLLRGIIKGRIPREEIDTLIDGGSFNSASAAKHYAEKFGMNAVYVISRLFPQHITDLLEDEHFKVIRAPKRYEHAIEREFYEHLVRLMKDSEFRRNKFCLWHARDGGKAMYPLGKETAKTLPQAPDYVLSCLGAGTTLEGLQLAVQDYFQEQGNKKPEVIVAEHELSPLFARIIPFKEAIRTQLKAEVDPNSYGRVNGLPHIVIGPHYDEINPLIPQEAIARIDGVVQYSEHDWMTMQKFLEENDISVGNSSAANLAAAASLANEGKVVLTVIFEPFRDFYKKHYDLPWILRDETPSQRLAFKAAAAAWLTAAAILGYGFMINPPPRSLYVIN